MTNPDPSGAKSAESREVAAEASQEERRYEISLRPSAFDDFVGQKRVTDNLKVFVEAARRRGDPLDHTLFCGPPGLGKTTLSFILAKELGVEVHLTSGPALEHKGQLAALVTKVSERDVLFIDEIHRLTPVVEESLYTAVEDFRIDMVHGDGPYAATLQIPIRPFTLVGATTRTGLLTSPMLSRFGYVARLDYYDVPSLATIVTRSARLLESEITEGGAMEVARRARGTPRIANRLLRRARDFAQVLGDGRLDESTAREALDRLDVDTAGLDEMDRRLLGVIIDHYRGGPVGIDTIAAALSEPRDTVEDVYEPYLLQQGFLARTARGRVATDKAFKHLGLKVPQRTQSLF